jgi:hypothetical protein
MVRVADVAPTHLNSGDFDVALAYVLSAATPINEKVTERCYLALFLSLFAKLRGMAEDTVSACSELCCQ